MITRASRLFFGLAAAAFGAAVLYGIVTNGMAHGGVWHAIRSDGAVGARVGPITFGYKGGVGDHLGYTLLMGFAAAAAAMGFTSSAFRDGDAESVAEVSGTDTAAPVVAPADLSPWPIVASVGVTI